MGDLNAFFSKKRKVHLDDCCRDFYENYILKQVLEGIDVSFVFPDYVKKTITEADNNFIRVDLQKLAQELIILRFELFALAWQHKFGIDSAIIQSTFTSNYLHEKKRGDIWGMTWNIIIK